MEGLKQVEEILKDALTKNDSDSSKCSNEDLEFLKNGDYFYVNTCHVCYSLDRVGKRLKRCRGCYMISYCGTPHQKKHWPEHKAICNAVQEIISTSGGPSVFGKTKDMDLEAWVKLKMNTMLVVALKLGRSLHWSEKNMFKFPRACAVCHESDPKALKNCLSCGNSSFCKDHDSDSAHKSLCPLFLSSYSLDRLQRFTNKMDAYDTVSVLLNSDAMKYIPLSIRPTKSPSHMKEFLEIYFREVVDLRRETCSSEYWNLFISQCFTRPLTLISMMEKMYFAPTSVFIVHVLGANNNEFSGLSVWETILHWIPAVKTLKIILIGPELIKVTFVRDLCHDCLLKKKSLEVEVQQSFYHDYMKNYDKYLKPNLVIGFNIGIAEFENPGSPEDTWKPTILRLARIEVPFILTAYTEKEAREEHKRMCYFLGNSTKYVFFEKNKFASLRPFRDVETEGIFYENNYVILYKELLKMNQRIKMREKLEKLENFIRLQKEVAEVRTEEAKTIQGRGNVFTVAKKMAETINREFQELDQEIENMELSD